MITKVYRYQLAADCWEKFLALQRRVDALCSKHISYEISFVRSAENPLKITEIHLYPDSCAAEKAKSLQEVEPELSRLFISFSGMLDPFNKQIEEEIGETFRVRD